MNADLLGIRYRADKARGHVESWSVKASAPDGSRAIDLRFTILAAPPLPAVAEAWAIAYDRERGPLAVKTTVGFGDAAFASGALDVAIDGCTLSIAKSRGALSSRRGSLAWDLAFGKPLAEPLLYLPRRLYGEGLPPAAKRVTLIADARAAGAIDVAGAHWSIDGWPMMLGHRWGPKHHEQSAFVHCARFDVEDLLFEATSARTRIGPLLSPMTTAAFVQFRGERWDFSGPRALTRNRGALSLRRWEMTGGSERMRVSCEVAAETDELVGMHDPNPSGPMTYRLDTGLARARLELELGKERIVAMSRAATLEIATMDANHGIRMSL